MKAKSWVVMCLLLALALVLAVAALNFFVDPFGVFGQNVWYSYAETLNPRVGKTAYLMEHADEYDSYLVGCSSTSSYPAEELNEYLDAKFYNTIVYGADMQDTRLTVAWLLEHCTVKNIVLNVYIDNGLTYATGEDSLSYKLHEAVSGAGKLGFYGGYLLASPQYALDKRKAQRDELLLLSVRAFFQEHFSLAGCSVRTVLYNDAVALMFTQEDSRGIYPILEELERLVALARSYLGMSLSIGIGRLCAGPQELDTSVDGARAALDYRVVMGEGRVLYIGDLEPDHSVRLSFEEEDQRSLSAAVKVGSPEQVEQVIDGLIGRVREARLSLSQCHLFFLETVTSLIKLARSGGVEVDEVFGPGFTGVVSITDFRSLEELGRWLVSRCLTLQELLGRQRTDSAWKTVERAKDFISRNYADSDLSVETLCSHLHLSPTYFSTLFKRETGMSFTSYVTNVRMEQAARLLRETDDKTYLIAEQTGDTDPNYFSYVFKRHFGVSPSKFRAGQAGQAGG